MRRLVKYEFFSLLCHGFVRKLLVVLPLIMILIMPWTATQDFRNLKLCVIDYDGSYASQRLVQKINASRTFTVTSACHTYSQALSLMEQGDADFIVEIEQGFEPNLFGGMANVMVSANNTTTMTGGLGSSFITTILQDFAAEMRAENVANINAPTPTNYNVGVKYLFNPTMDYKVFMFPVLLVIILTLISSFLPALVTNEQFFPVIRNYPLLVLSKTIAYIILGLAVAGVYILLIHCIFGFRATNIWAVATVALLFMFGFCCLSVFVGAMCQNMRQTIITIFILVFSGILLSGLIAPVNGMPPAARFVADLNPIRYFLESTRSAYIKDGANADMLRGIGVLAAFCLANYILAVLAFIRKKNYNQTI